MFGVSMFEMSILQYMRYGKYPFVWDVDAPVPPLQPFIKKKVGTRYKDADLSVARGHTVVCGLALTV